MSRAWGTEYYVKRLGPHRCEVAKFTMGVHPEAVYTVTYETCTCMIGFNCKHVRLVRQWTELGELPAVFWYDHNGWRHEPLKGLGGYNP